MGVGARPGEGASSAAWRRPPWPGSRRRQGPRPASTSRPGSVVTRRSCYGGGIRALAGDALAAGLVGGAGVTLVADGVVASFPSTHYHLIVRTSQPDLSTVDPMAQRALRALINAHEVDRGHVFGAGVLVEANRSRTRRQPCSRLRDDEVHRGGARHSGWRQRLGAARRAQRRVETATLLHLVRRYTEARWTIESAAAALRSRCGASEAPVADPQPSARSSRTRSWRRSTSSCHGD